MKKLLVSILAMGLVGIAHAGFDTYGLNYTTLLTPTAIGTNATAAEVLVVTNSATGANGAAVDLSGLIGKGALVLSAGGNGTVSFALQQCATTNGTFTTVTNAGATSYTVTNGATPRVIAITPNALSRYVRTVVTAATTVVTNGNISAMIVSY